MMPARLTPVGQACPNDRWLGGPARTTAGWAGVDMMMEYKILKKQMQICLTSTIKLRDFRKL
jgi:hypothetical protein